MSTDMLSDAFERYAEWAADVSPLYERLARGALERPDLLDLVASRPAGQPAPQLLLAAVHDTLLRDDDHRLAAYYATCTDDPRPPDEGDPVAAFRDCCRTRETRVRELTSTRLVQTNAVGRSAVLLPAFEYVARRADARPLALVEVGASAGLNLFADRFRFEYGDHGVYGDPDSPVCVETAVRGSTDPPLPAEPPAISHRVGVDRNPLDVADPDDATWLRALVPPDQRRRHERLDAALDLVDRPDLVAGDAVEVLSGVLSDLPDGAAVCVFSTLTVYQFDDATLDAFEAVLTEFADDRPVHWLSGDPESDGGPLAYRYVYLEDGQSESRRLAEWAPYGEWIRWLAAGD